MLKSLQSALLELEIAFNSSKAKNVLDKTNSLSKELKLLKNIESNITSNITLYIF